MTTPPELILLKIKESAIREKIAQLQRELEILRLEIEIKEANHGTNKLDI